MFIRLCIFKKKYFWFCVAFKVQHGREITSYEAFLHANIVTSQKQSNALEWANDLAKLVAKLASNGHLSTDIRLSSY